MMGSFFIMLLFVCSAIAVSALLIKLFNALPAKWFCDYDEQPGEELYRKRLFWKPHGLVMSFFLTVSFIGMHLRFHGFHFFLYCFACIVLLLIGISDSKYQIIPDAFSFALFLAAFIRAAYAFLHGASAKSAFLSPLLGAACGAGILLFLGLIGRLLFKKEAMGMGDVKLFGAIGFLTGFPQILFIFFLAIFLAFFHIIYLALCKKRLRGLYLPLGPYLCLAVLFFLTFQTQWEALFRWYAELLFL